MNKPLDEALSVEISQRIKSKAKKTFDNAYKAALATDQAQYVQGFLVFPGKPYQPIEHAWIELAESIVDPNLPFLKKDSQQLYYFPAASFNVTQLKEIIEESKEDYPEDDPLPIYGDAPYEYYGDVMLGGKNYLDAYQAAEAKSKEINQPNFENN
ncbi:hypothetical protein NIES37_20360 [Tolypothrix tenuis PCC 7101]|uniref:Uncharacterized protein n=1 Tax=Tolypothrix tenuis PCC 7101 TaxID=231146 RepID=A0A1Z4MXC2_9CYAN|nr:hypothetical protein [Aulosira sp. FACHB-113]BAY98088.1 hypothetical protein NIES37_20360 [Tolypothrix tenuis PCC 7101]BAZ77993.1 hypothetical protein NIES50_66260 [Aulosira laxa NIES-50]